MKDLNKKLTSLIIVFENCEYLELSMSEIKQLLLSDLSSALLVSSRDSSMGDVQSFNQCNNFYLWLAPELLNKEIRTKWTLGGSDGELWTYKTLFERGDIVSVDLVYNNDETDEYFVAWPESDEEMYVNPYQSLRCNKDSIVVCVKNLHMNKIKSL